MIRLLREEKREEKGAIAPDEVPLGNVARRRDNGNGSRNGCIQPLGCKEIIGTVGCRSNEGDGIEKIAASTSQPAAELIDAIEYVYWLRCQNTST